VGVVNSDSITATYATTATTNTPAGAYPITPTLVDPNNRLTNYTVATTNGTLTIGKAASVVTWTNPAPIIYGTALGTNQNDATANVPGNFVYNPTNGVVLNVGTNTLTVVFTPTDLVDYNPSTNTVSQVVLSAPLSVTANNASRPYGQTNPVFGGSLVGVVNSDNITATYATAATTNSSAGTYPIVPTLVDPNNRLTNYTVATTNGTLTIIKAATVVSWTNPAPIIYGTPLGTNQNDATANVPGTFVYNPTNGAVLNVGTNTLTMVFTPTDSVDYNPSTNMVSQVVLSAPLSVTASNASRSYGQTNPVFTGSLLGVVNSDNITATYATAATTNSSAGTYPIVPTLVDPNNRLTNYSVATTNGTLTINSASTVVTWTNPAPIIYGTPLDTNQNDATANVPGTFNYNPTNGTVLNAGTNTLTVVFTPTDSVDYNPATNSVNQVVLPAALSVIASNATRLYGVTNPSFTFGFSGFVNGEDSTHGDVAGQPLLTCSADPSSPIGVYTISNQIGSLTSTNYAFTLLNGVLAVNQAGLTITASNLSKAFAQTITFAGTEFSAAGLYNSDSVTNVLLISAGATNTAAVGPYPIVPSGAMGIGLSNYNVAYSNGTLTVVPPTPVVIGTPVPLADGTLGLTFSGGDPGVSYRLQANSSFPNPAWTNLSTNLAGAGGLSNFTDLDASNYPTRFYRTVAP
jgi:hypothetical protein